jgi:hypothetical protein
MKKHLEPKPTAPAAANAITQPDTDQPIYLPGGPFAEFHKLTRPHHLAQEHALAKDDPEAQAAQDPFALDDPQ